MSVVEELKQVRDWLSDENHWTKGHYGFANGMPIIAMNAEATCLVGACQKVIGDFDQGWDLARNVISCIDRDIQSLSLDGKLLKFNDSPETTHSDIMRVLDCAIEKEELKDE